MDTIDTSFTLDAFRLTGRDTKKDYKQKLKQHPVWRRLPETDVAKHQQPRYTEQIRTLAAHHDTAGVAFQCIIVAAIQVLENVQRREQQALGATLSLAQRQKLEAMVATVDATTEALRDLLTKQGINMLDQRIHRSDSGNEHLWWFALSEALHALEEGLAWIRSVAAGQVHGGAARTLSRIISLLLYAHYRDLFVEAEQWMN